MFDGCDGPCYPARVVVASGYPLAMSKKPVRGRGRPKINPVEGYTQRHVVNITVEMEDAAKQFAASQGVIRMTDALRMLVVKGLKAEGLLK